MKKFILLQLLLIAIFSVSAQPKVQRVNPWPMDQLLASPKYTMSKAENGTKKVIYETMDYRGAKRKVFAYYSTPGILKGKPELDKNLPAVVLVHGGGGQAFENWARMWAEKGYAAISMNTYGKDGEKLQLEGGLVMPKGSFVATQEDQKEDWFFNAVADAVSAHSLLLSLKEVDKNRTALTGISWGGIITTLVAGLDPRFKVAVPTYGCGYLYQTGSMAPQIIRDGERTVNRWKTMYDPALWVVDAKCPMLFVNGTKDNHFYMNQWQASIKATAKAERSARVELRHGHGSGWKNTETFSFISYHLGVGNALPSTKFSAQKFANNTLTCTIKDAPQGAKAYLCHTVATDINNKAEWAKTEVAISGSKLSAKVDPSYNQFFFSVEYPNGDGYSGEIVFRQGDKLW